MSYPSSLDLAFGSEKATADPMGRLSFGKGGRSLPTTQEELQELEQEGLAYTAQLQGDAIWLDLGKLPDEVIESLPDNLLGVVCGEGELRELSFTVTSTDPLTIKVSSEPVFEETVSLILKQAVNTENP